MRDPADKASDDHPSRSARRREALDILALARKLSETPRARLAQLGLPDDILDELTRVDRTPSHIAHKRELVYLAKLMRAHDDTDFAAARAALANDRAAGAREAAALQRIEALRKTLLGDDGAAALTAFIRERPQVDTQRLRTLIRKARRERDAAKPPRAQRELFRFLRESRGTRTE